MKTNQWLRVFTCGVTFGVGNLLGVPSLEAADDPTLASGNTLSVKDDSTPAVKTKRKAKSKRSGETSQAESSESANPKTPISSPKSDAPPSEYALATALLGSLSAEHMKSLGEMLEQDWQERPEWGDMAVAILKNDFMRHGSGWWKPSAQRHDWKWLSERLDANKDGQVEREEFPSDLPKADQLFERLDRDGDGKLTVADFDHSESAAPSPMNMAAMKDRMSKQLFSRLDKDSNGRVTMQELAEFFRYGDKEELEFLTSEDLRFAIDEPPSKKPASKVDDNPAAAGPSTPAAAMRMFLRGDMGWLTAGPQLGDVAPDFTLPNHDGTQHVKLSDSFGKRPVVLVFGSFT